MTDRILAGCATILFIPILFVAWAIYGFTLGGLFDWFFQTIFFLVAGWIFALPRLLGGLRHEPFALVVGLTALVLLPIVFHHFVRKLSGVSFRWKFRQSVAVIGIVCSLVIATIGMIAAIHEVYWIAYPTEAWTERWMGSHRIDDHGRLIEDTPRAKP